LRLKTHTAQTDTFLTCTNKKRKNAGVSTPHTAMVGFETTASKFEKFKALPPAQRREKIAKWALGGAAGVGIVAGAAVAIALGSLAATAANAPVAEAAATGAGMLLDLAGGGGGGGGDCCGHCDCALS
jgi:L-alanine-DL-glutamate epimerase-like enolase superfamily enzyme